MKQNNKEPKKQNVKDGLRSRNEEHAIRSEFQDKCNGESPLECEKIKIRSKRDRLVPLRE